MNAVWQEGKDMRIHSITANNFKSLIDFKLDLAKFLSDDLARAGVMYLYKTPEGSTRAIPFFSIPSLARKLTVMGPGEAFVDTNLTLLGDEIAQMPEGR
jgi:hypothetical protein